MGYSNNLAEKKLLQMELEIFEENLKAFDNKIEEATDLEEATLLYQERNLMQAKYNAFKDRIEKKKGRDVMVMNFEIIT